MTTRGGRTRARVAWARTQSVHRFAPALLLLATACAGPNDVPAGKTRAAIVGGTVDEGDPAVVALELTGGGLCSGTLISPRVVLTAEHCVLQGPRWGAVLFGTLSGAPTRRVLAIDSVAHPETDLRLVKLGTPVRDIAPIPYNTESLSFLTSDLIRHVGFGLDDWPNGQSGTKREVTLRVIAAPPRDVVHVSLDGGTGACFGDSGGPGLMRLTPGGPEVVAGVASTLYDEPLCRGGTVDARVDTYASWIGEISAGWEAETCEGGDGCKADCERADPDCVCAWDGVCDPRCPRFSMDPDCPPACDRDGICSIASCPFTDLDCTPTGEACTKDTDCQGRACATQGGKRYCSKGCQSDLECPSPMYCSTLNKVCFLLPSLGDACDATKACREGACVDKVCTPTCITSKTCAPDEQCLATSASPGVCRKKTPEPMPQKQGCAAAPSGVALAALVLYGKRRRSKSPPVVV